MSQPRIHTTSKLQDKQIIQLTRDIEQAFQGTIIKFFYGDINIPHEGIEEVLGENASYVISKAQVSLHGNAIHVAFHRGTSGVNAQNDLAIDNRIPSPYFDEIIITIRNIPKNQPPDTDVLIKLEQIIAKYVSSKVPKFVEAGAQGAIDLLQCELANFSATYNQMIADASKQRLKLEDEFKEKQNVLETNSASEKTKLETKAASERKEIERLHEKSRNEIEDLQKKLDEARKAVDDRNHMHVRRQLRENMTESITERVSNNLHPSAINLMGWSVFAFSILCALGAGYFAFASYTLLYQDLNAIKPAVDNTYMIILLVRSSITSFITIAFLTYALSWLRSKYIRDIETVDDLHRYSLDINRASWTIETIMEMTTKEGANLPEKWIEGVCYGLFRNPEKDKTEITPLDAWGALLNVSGKVEYGPDGPKMEFNKRQSRQLAKGSETT